MLYFIEVEKKKVTGPRVLHTSSEDIILRLDARQP
jgi:hypothetical protein